MKNARKALKNLSAFVQLLTRDKVTSKESFSLWVKDHQQQMAELFGYGNMPDMPPISSLVRPFFHPELPLIGLNYTPAAHNILYEMTEGWTPELRLCRGIIFDRDGQLVALAFEKFFNHGEHPETSKLPDLAFEATTKHDGHLGIIFRYQGQLLITTRGSFLSPTSKLAQKMLARYVKQFNWQTTFPEQRTVLVEIIHPQTQVHLDYSGAEKFVLIGCYDNRRLTDYDYPQLTKLAQLLQLEVTELWTGRSLSALVKLMADRSITDREGYVVRFSNGLRIKVKFQTYIAKMVESKLSFGYLMNRMKAGNLERMLETLPEEIYSAALGMLGQIMMAVAIQGDAQTKWRNLYQLVPPEQSTPYFQSVCRSFVRSLLKQP